MHGTLTLLAIFVSLIFCKGFEFEDDRRPASYNHKDYIPDLAFLAMLADTIDGDDYQESYGSVFEKRAIPQPRVGRAVPHPRIGRSIPQPRIGRSLPQPRIGRDIPKPRIGRSIPQPRIGRAIPQPRIGRAIPQPRIGRDASFDKTDHLFEILSLPESQETLSLLAAGNEQLQSRALMGPRVGRNEILNKLSTRAMFGPRVGREEEENGMESRAVMSPRVTRSQDEEANLNEMHSDAKEEE